MAVLGTINFRMGVEILNTNSYRSFEARVVCAQKNRLIEMAASSTPNFCFGVETLNKNSYLSFGTCVVCAQKNRLIKDGCFGYPQLLHGRGNFEYKYLSIFRGMHCWCSKKPAWVWKF